jgi:hypothetical protein
VAANTSTVTQYSNYSSTDFRKRDISEIIRRLNPDITKMLALVKGSNLDAYGKPAYSGKGMIRKKACKRMDPEWTTITPIAVMYVATGGSSTTIVVADNTYFQVGDQVVNTTTAEVCIVTAVDSGGTDLTVKAVSGGTWSCSADQYVAMLASAYEEGTERYSTVSNEPTVNKTYLQIFREGLSIADTTRKTESYTRENQVEMYHTEKMLMTLRKLETNYWFSKKSTASTGTTSITVGSTAYPVYSMQGMLDYAGTAIDLGGTFNWENWNTVLYPQMPTTLRAKDTIYAAMGRKLASVMNQWATDSYLAMGTNSGEMKFGKKIKTYYMGGNLEVEPLVLDCFDTGGMDDSIMFFQSSDLDYLFYEGYDLQVRENAQSNSAMKKDDIFEGIVGLRSYTNGANIKWVKNCLKAA